MGQILLFRLTSTDQPLFIQPTKSSNVQIYTENTKPNSTEPPLFAQFYAHLTVVKYPKQNQINFPLIYLML
jgi:hypothetical protein